MFSERSLKMPVCGIKCGNLTTETIKILAKRMRNITYGEWEILHLRGK